MIKLKKMRLLTLSLLVLLFISTEGFAQRPAGSDLDKIPVSLETDYALSALPARLRHDATVYLLDPQKGYYMAHKGNNGFICYVIRTEWIWPDFRKDLATAISFDAEGARTIFPVDRDVAAMRASGKFTATQVKDLVVDRIKKGVYKAPARAGMSYMLAPMMRTHTGKSANDNTVMTMNMPHLMDYAPYITNADIGGSYEDGPMVVNAGAFLLGERKAPYGFIIYPTGETERAKILKDNKELLKRLTDYKAYFKTEEKSMRH